MGLIFDNNLESLQYLYLMIKSMFYSMQERNQDFAKGVGESLCLSTSSFGDGTEPGLELSIGNR